MRLTSPAPLPTLPDRSLLLAPLAACSGLALLVVAQTQLQAQHLSLITISALALGSFAWLIALWVAPPTPDRRDPLIAQERTVSWPLVTLAYGLAVLTWIATGDGVYTLFGVGVWIGAIGAWCWAWWPVTAADQHQTRVSRQFLIWLALGAILVVGALFRFYRLAEVPADPTSDHAEKLLDIRELVNGRRPIFFPRNTGREPGQFYLTYSLMRLFGLPLSFETLKVGTALIGLLAIPAVFLFGRELAGATAGLIAATGFAISKWVVNTARMGLRFPYGPLPMAIVLWLLFRYLRRGDRRDALWCGLAIGLGLHGYISFRIVPLVVLLVLAWTLLVDRRWRANWRTLAADGALLVTTAVLSCLPLIHYTVQHPEQVWYRVATRAASAERKIGSWSDTLHTFLVNNRNAMLAFNWRGDATVVNAVQYDPFLDFVTGGALLAGLLIVGYQIGVRRSPRYSALALAAPVLLLPSTLNLAFPIENPSANRIGTVAPVIFVIAALPLAYLVEQLWASANRRRTLILLRRTVAIVVLGSIFVLATQQNYMRYFRDYDRQYRSRVPNTHEIVRHLRQQQAQGIDLDQIYILAFPHWLDGRNLALMLGDPSWQEAHDLASDTELPTRADDQPLLFLLHPDDLSRKQQLEARYPEGSYAVIQATPPGKNFALYLVPGR